MTTSAILALLTLAATMIFIFYVVKIVVSQSRKIISLERDNAALARALAETEHKLVALRGVERALRARLERVQRPTDIGEG